MDLPIILIVLFIVSVKAISSINSLFKTNIKVKLSLSVILLSCDFLYSTVEVNISDSVKSEFIALLICFVNATSSVKVKLSLNVYLLLM